MSKHKKIRFIIHYVKPTAQLLFKIRFPKGGPTCRRQVVNPRHQTPQGQSVAKPETPLQNIVKLFHTGGLIYFEIAAATLLMTVNMASRSGKRYWNTASLDQSQRIFIVASAILHMSSQVAIPFLRLWVEQFSRPRHARHRDFSLDRNFVRVKQVKAPCWFRNENRGAPRSAGALVMKFRIAVTEHKTWPFMKGNTT